jgi:hypothetical protein
MKKTKRDIVKDFIKFEKETEYDYLSLLDDEQIIEIYKYIKYFEDIAKECEIIDNDFIEMCMTYFSLNISYKIIETRIELEKIIEPEIDINQDLNILNKNLSRSQLKLLLDSESLSNSKLLSNSKSLSYSKSLSNSKVKSLQYQKVRYDDDKIRNFKSL